MSLETPGTFSSNWNAWDWIHGRPLFHANQCELRKVTTPFGTVCNTVKEDACVDLVLAVRISVVRVGCHDWRTRGGLQIRSLLILIQWARGEVGGADMYAR
jgi:hypothetical protein